MIVKRPKLCAELLLLSALLVGISGCLATASKSNKMAIKHQPNLWPKLPPAFEQNEAAEAIENQIDQLLEQMSVAQKVGQITQAEFTRITPEQVRDFHIGSVLNGGGAFLKGNKNASLEDWADTLERYYEASVDTSNGGLAIPIIWGTDAVHGHNKLYGATTFPHNIGLGASRNGELVRRIAELTAAQVRASGMDWTFSPALSVVRNDRWGRSYEGFSEDPALVAQLGKQAVLGYQGDLRSTQIMDDKHVAATGKHYLADGGTVDGIDRGNNFDQEADLIRYHGLPYFDAIEAGVLSLMASHSSWQGNRLHGDQYLLTDILKNRLGFDGVVVGDWNSHGLIDGCTNDHCPAAINAGVDLLMVPFEWQQFIKNTIADVESGAIKKSRLDDAVRRVLRLKFRSGLMQGSKPSQRSLSKNSEAISGPEVKAVARQAVRESLVLLKNNHRTLPLSPMQNVLITGSAADNIAQQNGGWTLSWQANDTSNEDFPNATSIFTGIKQVVEQSGGHAELSRDASYHTRPDVAIVVYGETPYAEWQGDLPHVGFETGFHQHAKILEYLQAQNIPTVSVFVSGRPLWVNRELNASDAFVAAWLPGSEGAGIADVLFTDQSGQPRHDFSGVLPFSWPRTIDQAELNIGAANYEPLFSFGYGLNYSKARYLGNLPTDETVVLQAEQAGIAIFEGTVKDPWQIYATEQNHSPARFISGMTQTGSITIAEGDQHTQGDALLVSWRGDREAALQINNPNANRNLESLLTDDGALLFDMKVIKPAQQKTELELACRGEGCDAAVDITAHVQDAENTKWQSHSVAMACFAKRGLNFREVTRAFALRTSGALEVAIANIRFAPNSAAQTTIPCTPEQ